MVSLEMTDEQRVKAGEMAERILKLTEKSKQVATMRREKLKVGETKVMFDGEDLTY